MGETKIPSFTGFTSSRAGNISSSYVDNKAGELLNNFSSLKEILQELPDSKEALKIILKIDALINGLLHPSEPLNYHLLDYTITLNDIFKEINSQLTDEQKKQNRDKLVRSMGKLNIKMLELAREECDSSNQDKILAVIKNQNF